MPADTETFRSVCSLDIRVYYEDTDAGGVVYYANYLKFFERGRTEWLRQLGVDQTALATDEHLLFVVRDLAIRYIRPARLDDRLTVTTRLTSLGGAALQFQQIAQHLGNKLCETTVRICTIDSRSFQPVRLPQHLRSLIEKAQNQP